MGTIDPTAVALGQPGLNGGPNGSSVARSIATSVGAVTSSAGAGANPGQTGSGAGGAATAVATGAGSSATVVATAAAGAGSSASGSGHTAGKGAVASAKASGAGTTATTVTASATGGAGGAGANGANGGAGATTALTNAVSGMTNGGMLTLTQKAVGGAGGAASGGGGAAGAGGGAPALLTLDDSKNATQSATVNATSVATGGAGATSAGGAYATVDVVAAAGTFNARAQTSLLVGQLVQSLTATANGVLAGSGEGLASAIIGGSLRAALVGAQSVAIAAAAPSAAATSAVFRANRAIATAFGATPRFFALGELGGAHAGPGTASQTATSEIDETVDLTKLTTRQHLVVGFYSGATTGAGVTAVGFDLYADGMDVLHKSFASAAAAQTWFTDNAVDLGSLASGQPLGGSTLTLRAVMTVTTDAGGSGFSGNLIIGDPPGAPAPTHGLVAAMAAFAPRAGGTTAHGGLGMTRMPQMLARPA